MAQRCEHHPEIRMRVGANLRWESETDVVIVNHLQKTFSTAFSNKGCCRFTDGRPERQAMFLSYKYNTQNNHFRVAFSESERLH